jgi:predicted transcriptional regulator
MLRILEDKGHLSHSSDGPRYVFRPTVPREEARESALRRVVNTFFGGSPENAVAALLELDDDRLDEDALARIARRIADARKDGR